MIMYLLRAKPPLRFLNYSTITKVENILEPLNRHLIEIRGEENTEFLQGLITNNINHLSANTNSIFSMFLNTKGRVLCDSIIYRFNGSSSIFVECDMDVLELLEKHLKTYRVKRKIEVISLKDQYVVYALFNSTYLKQKHSGVHIDISKMTNQNVSIFKDPRATELGFRVITKVGFDVNEVVKSMVNIKLSSQINNRMFRYCLGIGEGSDDHPIGNSFPLECNCDYLHGVSFNKGCYIGQELTARTYHTGVVRKRLMSLKFSQIPTKLPKDNIIMHENIRLGKLRGVEDNVGLALLNVHQALSLGEINVGNGKAIVKMPDWWPIQALKVDNNMRRV